MAVSMSYARYLEGKWQLLVERGIPESSFVSGYELNVQEILKEISLTESSVSRPDLAEEYEDLLTWQYIHDVWIAELRGKASSETEEVCAYVVDGDWEMAEQCLLKNLDSAEYAARLIVKLKNMRGVISEYFFGRKMGNTAQQVGRFSLEFVKELHKKIMEDLLDNAGEFREKSARPAGSNFVYLQPERINTNLRTLLKFVQDEARLLCGSSSAVTGVIKTNSLILLGAQFLSEFLYIHPFSNGNGRTARILLNLLLADVCMVPFSLFVDPPLSGEHPRDLYISTLSSIHGSMSCGRSTQLPDHLAAYILLCVQRHVSLVSFEAAAGDSWNG